MKDLKELELTIEQNKHLSFEEYKAIREPSYNVIINDYACKLVERAKENGEELSLAEAKEIAKTEIPTAFIPEWMKNLRISANIAGTELVYLESISSNLLRLEELLSVALEPQIQAYIERHQNDFKREEE